jgi:hypothetical protein
MEEAVKKRTARAGMKSTQETVGTLMFYGPTPTLATKVVIGTTRKADSRVLSTREWRDVGDVRQNALVAKEIVSHVRAQKIQTVAGIAGVGDCAHDDRNLCGCDDTIYGADPAEGAENVIIEALVDAGLNVRIAATQDFVDVQHQFCSPAEPEAPINDVDAFLAQLQAPAPMIALADREEYERVRAWDRVRMPAWEDAPHEDGQIGLVYDRETNSARLVAPSVIRSGHAGERPTHTAIVTVAQAVELLRETTEAPSVGAIRAMVSKHTVNGKVGIVFYPHRTAVVNPAVAKEMQS